MSLSPAAPRGGRRRFSAQLVAAVVLLGGLSLISRARAQGGNMGEGPGWLLFLAVIWLAGTVLLGSVAALAIWSVRRRSGGGGPRRRWIALSYLVAALSLLLGGALALALESAIPLLLVPGVLQLAYLGWVVRPTGAEH